MVAPFFHGPFQGISMVTGTFSGTQPCWVADLTLLDGFGVAAFARRWTPPGHAVAIAATCRPRTTWSRTSGKNPLRQFLHRLREGGGAVLDLVPGHAKRRHEDGGCRGRVGCSGQN